MGAYGGSANQHYEGFLKLMEEQNLTSCHPVLLTGSTTARQKREIYQKIASGEVNVIIGTHALIQEKVEYKNLGLVSQMSSTGSVFARGKH